MSRDRTWGWRAWRWAPHERGTAWFCAALAVVCGVFAILAIAANFHGPKAFPFGDFFALWSYARIVMLHPAAWLYDPVSLHQAQVALGMLPGEQNPFPYPPTFLLLVWPIGLLPFWPAYIVWIGGSFCLYLLATGLGVRGKAGMAVVALFAPTTAACVVSGQSGFLLAALLVGGLRLARSRPVLAGILFGLLTYKPQFGLLVPVALLAAGWWRCIIAACATTAALSILDTAAFGSTIWLAWWRSLPGYVVLFDRDTAANRTIPTVLGNVQALGFSHGVAQVVQAAAALMAAAAVWVAWRRPGPFAIPALLAATCLATPHAFLYDLPLLSSGALLFAGERMRTRGTLVLPEVAVLTAVLAMPVAVTVLDTPGPLSTVTVGLFLWLAVAAGRTSLDLGTVRVGAKERPGTLPPCLEASTPPKTCLWKRVALCRRGSARRAAATPSAPPCTDRACRRRRPASGLAVPVPHGGQPLLNNGALCWMAPNATGTDWSASMRLTSTRTPISG